MKKIFAIVLIFIFCFMFSGTEIVSAATVKLNKTTLTVNEGQSYTLKLSGTTKTVKWSTSNKAIATVSTKGIVKGIKAGTATITATASNKKYNCKVTVKEVFNAKKAVQNLSVEDYSLSHGVIQIVKNNYIFPMDLEATIVYYDSSNMMIGKSGASNYYFEKGAECILFYSAPTDSNYDYVPYDHYKITYSASLISYMKSNLKDIEIASNIGIENVMLEVTNSGGQSAEFTQIAILFYQNGEIVGYDYQYADVQEPGSTDYLEFSFPWDENYETIQIDDYKIYINSSYYYDF
jgi:hypothetical protein